MALEDHIRDIPDFPKPGIVFKDITPLFLDAGALREAVDALAAYARERDAQYVVPPRRAGSCSARRWRSRWERLHTGPHHGPNPGDGL